MKLDCEVIRDLLPLYADKACSEATSALVEEHLRDCPACRDLVSHLLQTELENSLHEEREEVLQYGARQLRRRSAAVGSAVSGIFVIPLLIIFAVNVARGMTVSWVAVVMSALCVAASLIVVPLTVREDKAFWTFCAFCASLILLIGMTCLYVHGDWFRIAAGAVLFGLSVIFLPFVIKARPLKALIGNANRWLIVLGIDVALFFNLLNAIDTRGSFTVSNLMFTIGAVCGILCVVIGLIRNRKA